MLLVLDIIVKISQNEKRYRLLRAISLSAIGHYYLYSLLPSPRRRVKSKSNPLKKDKRTLVLFTTVP